MPVLLHPGDGADQAEFAAHAVDGVGWFWTTVEHDDFGFRRERRGGEPLHGPFWQAVSLETATPVVGPIAELIGGQQFRGKKGLIGAKITTDFFLMFQEVFQ